MRLESLNIEEGKGNGKKKGKKGKKGKNRRGGLNSVENVAQTAHEQGKLSLEAYNEVMEANLDDIQHDSLLGDAVVVYEPFAPPPVDDPGPPSPCPPSPCPPSLVTVSIPESVDGSPAATSEPCLSDENQTEHIVPFAPAGIDQADSRCVGPAGQPDPTAEVEVKDASGRAFLHCLACPRLDIVEYGQRRLPEFLKAFAEDDEFNTVLILCGTCRKKPKYCGQDKTTLESLLASYFDQVWMKPEVFEKGDGVQAARVLTGREVHLLMLGESPAYGDIDRIIKHLGPDDRVSSVDMERFAAGHRDHLRHSHLRGGLTSS